MNDAAGQPLDVGDEVTIKAKVSRIPDINGTLCLLEIATNAAPLAHSNISLPASILTRTSPAAASTPPKK